MPRARDPPTGPERPSSPPIEGPRVRAVLAGPSTSPQIQACFEGAPDYFARTEGGPPGADAAERLLADAEGDDLRRVYALVPVVGGPAVGVLDLYLAPPRARASPTSRSSSSASRARGSATARRRPRRSRRRSRAPGTATLRLSVGDENPEAKAFWERIGFAEVGRLDRGVTVYEKRLG